MEVLVLEYLENVEIYTRGFRFRQQLLQVCLLMSAILEQ
jgi:hypothetical protein